ncbi:MULTISPECIES: M20 family metallopeptidase [unclassified Dietzia]|uniref:M20 family metallopeptidase n=1 Tax=unclassified Dietzia TaxID=2617939 RepID=UPI000D206176|nr:MULTISPECIES: M20 family metallopeptidase [unclassified Dietzia]AVZ40861.1 amidohydrolase [Dietzia sp. JS16-p6b]MBB1022868.1 amidohydrolase [Dietzia sp. DQ12-76]MBB1028999.1 amidohydrolase [Dietzia sp. DQ11-38-2]QGW26485.1 glutamate--cysteine ligase, GCS2 family/ peptidase [Dietzia sp. DQ12-45-1b]
MFGRKKGDTADAGGFEGRLIGWRRHIHTHPELSYEETETTDYIEGELRSMGLRPTRFRIGTGLWCDVPAAEGATATDVVALRADIDALAMSEDSGESFASEVDGVAHTCGHDGHTAMLLGAAEMLVADPPPRPVRLIFQPAEETMPGGAKECVEEGVVEGVDRILALHCDPHRRVGEVGVTGGAITSSNAKIGVTVHSNGGHTARPHETQDTVFALAQIVTGVTAVVDRTIDPRSGTVLTWASIKAGGTAPNVIPDSGQLWGTLRSADRDVWATAEPVVRGAVESIAATYGLRAEVEYVQGVPPVVNDQACADLAASAVEQVLGPDGVGTAVQSSGGEDFAWYTEEIPGVYLRLGVWDGESEETDLHHPGFVLDEAALPHGARIFDAFARLHRGE